MSLSSRLNCKVGLYSKTPGTNELDEITYSYAKTRSLWAEIIPMTGSVQSSEGNTKFADISHKITIRSGINLTNDMYFMFKGQRYDIKYFNPNYKYRDRIEIMCSLVVE